MDERVYGAVTVVPTVLSLFLAVTILLCMRIKYPDKVICIATSTFNNVLYYSVEEKKKKLYFLELRITDRETAEKLSFELSLLFAGLLATTMNMFLFLLLLDVSYECQEGFDCYKYMSFDFDFDPVNCEVTRNGSAHVICYRFTFNLFLATGVGYGVLKVSLVAVYLCSMLILHIHKNSPNSKRITCALQVVGGLLVVAVVTLVSLNARYAAVSAADAIRYSCTFGTVVMVFMCLNRMVPWSQLAELEQPVEDFTDDVRTPSYVNEIGRINLRALADENNLNT